MYDLLIVIHVLVALLLIGLVLFQADEGSGLGGAFGTSAGSGGGSMFGKKGAAGVVTRFTAILVTVFLLTSFLLTFIISREYVDRGSITPVQSAPRSPLPPLSGN
jgi:preprotein translocase subunit SecG